MIQNFERGNICKSTKTTSGGDHRHFLWCLPWLYSFQLALITWPAGWIFLLLFFGFYLTVTLWLYRHNPGLMQERMRLGTSDQQGWDKILFPMMEIFFISMVNFHIIGRGSLSLVCCATMAANDWCADPIMLVLLLVLDF